VDRLGHVKCVKFNTNFLTVYKNALKIRIFEHAGRVVADCNARLLRNAL